MDKPFLAFLVVIALITALPAWLTGSILKKSSKESGGGGTDWVPLGFVVYGLTEFKHPKKLAIVWAYVFSNVLSWGAIVWLLVYYLRNKG
jgi:hypothetical protein